MNIGDSLIVGGTVSLKEINQDYVLQTEIAELKCNVLVVADGLGSFHYSEVASEFVCKKFVEAIEKLENINDLNLVNIFEEVQIDLKKKYEEDIPEDDRIKNAYGTTLISCIETLDDFIIGYVGNGGIFHIRGDFNNFPERFYLPWNSINLLNPHSKEEEGKNAMYKFLSPNGHPEQIIPSVIRLSKDRFGSGDIIMICTDGIYSYDEVKIGKDPNGKIWISGETAMELFYKHLKLFFKKENYNNDNLNESIQDYLGELKSKKLLDDDATLSLLISSTALNYQKSLTQMNEEDK